MIFKKTKKYRKLPMYQMWNKINKITKPSFNNYEQKYEVDVFYTHSFGDGVNKSHVQVLFLSDTYKK